MPKQTKNRLRTPYEPPVARRPVEYEPRNAERRRPAGSEPRLGPYETQYAVDMGYATTQRGI